jgi:hypothetical protein
MVANLNFIKSNLVSAFFLPFTYEKHHCPTPSYSYKQTSKLNVFFKKLACGGIIFTRIRSSRIMNLMRPKKLSNTCLQKALAVETEVAHTGVFGLLETGKPSPDIELRADIDALPVTVGFDQPYKSNVKTTFNGVKSGVMHSCWHQKLSIQRDNDSRR